MPKIGLDLTRPMVLPQHLEFDEEQITLGRSKSCTCFIDDRFLSRTHAVLSARDGKWFIQDCDSANGTVVNGVRLDREIEFRFNDVIAIGDTEIRMGGTRPQDEITAVGIDAATTTPPEPPEPDQIPDLVIEEDEVRESAERTMIVHRLALELISGRSMQELFEVIVDHVMEAMTPSRVAISLLGDDGESLEIASFRSTEESDESRLTISRTLLSQIIEERKVIAYTDVGSKDGEIPESMVVQRIFSALGAPLLVNDRVLGVLYLDYRRTDRVISEDDAQLAAQIARVAAIKVESSRLRERHERGTADTLERSSTEQMNKDATRVPNAQETIRSIGPRDRKTLPGPAGAPFVREEMFGDGHVWVGMVTTEPGAASPWHHHGSHETYVYMLEGEALVEFGPDGKERIHAKADGSLQIIPPGLAHREINTGPTPNRILVVRVGEGQAVFPLDVPPSGER